MTTVSHGCAAIVSSVFRPIEFLRYMVVNDNKDNLDFTGCAMIEQSTEQNTHRFGEQDAP